jgi:cobalt/nickel transport system permease protein
MKHYTFDGSLRDVIDAFENITSMEQSYRASGILQKINPLVKVVSLGSFIVTALIVDSLISLFFLAIVITSMALVTKVSIKIFIYRSTFIPIFALIISLPLIFLGSGDIIAIGWFGLSMRISLEGILRMLTFTGRVWVSVATLVLLTSTTEFAVLVQVLRSLRAPRFLIAMTFMTYRYLFLTLHEVYRLLLAKESRTFTKKRNLNLGTLRSIGNLFGALFIRAYERSERVYLAMVARGYVGLYGDNKMEGYNYGVGDISFGMLLVALDAIAISLHAMRIGWL